MDSKFQATLLKKSGNICCSCRGRWNNKISLGSVFPKGNLMNGCSRHTPCALLNSSSGCLSLGTRISSIADGGQEKHCFHSGKEYFFRAQTSLSVILSPQWFNAAVRWPGEPALANQRCQIKPLHLSLHFQLT